MQIIKASLKLKKENFKESLATMFISEKILRKDWNNKIDKNWDIIK